MSNPLLPVPSPGYQPVAPVDVEATVAPAFRAQKFLAFLLRYWWIPLLALVLSLATAVLYVRSQPPTFVSKARMWQNRGQVVVPGQISPGDDPNFLGTTTELLQSLKLRELTLERLRAFNKNLAIPLGVDREPLPVSIRVLGSAKSAVFLIEASGTDANYVRSYLDAIMESFLEYKKNVRDLLSGDTLASITEQVQKAERDLKGEQDVLTAFEKTNNLAILQQQGSVAGAYLTRLKTELSDLQLEDNLLRAAAGDKSILGGETNRPMPDLANLVSSGNQAVSAAASAERQTAAKELEVLKIQRARLSKHLRPKHPKIVKLDADIDRTTKLLEVFHNQSTEQLAATREANRLKTQNIQGSIKDWESQVVEAQARIAEADRLKLNVQRAQSFYDRLVLLQQNASLNQHLVQGDVSKLEAASLPKRSYATETNLVATAGVGGLGLGLAIVLLLAVRDDRFASALDVTERLGDGVVGQVPELPGPRGRRAMLSQNGDDPHMYVESFRNLRSALLFLAVDGARPKVILITSALPNEGKSTVAANLARTLALGGSRVLLVDGDLRKGTLHELLDLKREPGLSQVLRDGFAPEAVIQSNCLPGFSFVASGSRLNNPGDLFLGSSLDQLLAHWRERFDYVLIDSSPVFAADDAPTLAPKVDGTLFVVRSRFSGERHVREALELLQRRQARILGLVFNRANASARSYSYYRYSQYYAANDK